MIESRLGVNLREVGRSDLATVLRIIRESFEEYRGVIDPPSNGPNETEETISRKMQTATAVLAEADGVPIGCVFYEPEPGHVYLSRLAVLKEYRRRGIGRALIGHVERRAVAMGLP